MDKSHFILATRYRAIMRDGTEIKINLLPEKCYYFKEQEKSYLINAIRSQCINVDKIVRIEKYFVPVETLQEVEVVIGL